MIKKSFLLLLFGAWTVCVFGQGKIIIITSFGAEGNGITLNTANIQSAIDAVSTAGGGKIIFPKGKFLTGGIILKSGVELHFEKDAVMLGSTDPSQYNTINRREALIMASGQEDISITGNGIIDGQGRKLALNIDSLFYAGKLDSMYYNLRRKRPEKRPKILEIDNCRKILISGIILKNSASWVQNYDKCKNLVIDSIRVESDAYWNNDGIDITDCRNVRVTNCYVNSADDGICLKSENKGFMNDSVYIANCTVRSSASAVKFGTASTGGFKNIKIENIKVFDTFRSAIAIESVDGGILENVEVNNIEANNTGNAIFIRLGHRNSDGAVGTLKNVTIRNVKVQVPFGPPDLNYEIRGPELAFFHNPFPSSIAGIPGHKIENVVLENIEIIMPGRGNDGMAILPLYRLQDVPENEIGYPEFSMFGELPAWGFYVRHVDGLTMNNVKVEAESKDYRPAFVFDDIMNLKMENTVIKENDSGKQVIFRNVINSDCDVKKELIKVVK
jgi:polygalacturonase